MEVSIPEQTIVTADLQMPYPMLYGERSYQLITEMINAYKRQEPGWVQTVADAAAQLKEEDPCLGETWEQIIAYWDYANTRMEIPTDALSAGLPTDESLCIVVLGFQLTAEGEMMPELQGRCEQALRAAEQYPKAYLLVTGGGTAFQNPDKTEAGVMAQWLRDQGIAAERLIVEDRSLSTEQNARFSQSILTRSYPQIRHLVIVSSDYHLPLGCLLFTEAALLYACQHGELPYTVDGCLGFPAPGLEEYTSPMGQAAYVRSLADLQWP